MLSLYLELNFQALSAVVLLFVLGLRQFSEALFALYDDILTLVPMQLHLSHLKKLMASLASSL